MLVDPVYIANSDDVITEGRLFVASQPAHDGSDRLVGTGADVRLFIPLTYDQVIAKWVTVAGAATKEETFLSQTYTKSLFLATWLADLTRQFASAAMHQQVKLDRLEREYGALQPFEGPDTIQRQWEIVLSFRRLRVRARYWQRVLADLRERLDMEKLPGNVEEDLDNDRKLVIHHLDHFEEELDRIFTVYKFPSAQRAVNVGVRDGEVGDEFPPDLLHN
ncbi:hypothetical protein B0H21DRAFT_826600 [Amylocystis lapponica]|nr:hypothetical protein B0H21DRAFT_826600 [Amylocystis lapponica]